MMVVQEFFNKNRIISFKFKIIFSLRHLIQNVMSQENYQEIMIAGPDHFEHF